MRSDNVTSQVALTTGVNLALLALGVASGILVARLLGTTGRGELAAIQLWPTFLATVAMFGLPEALGYYSASDAVNRGRYLSTATLMAVFSSLIFMVGGYFAIPILLQVQSADTIRASQAYLLLLPLMALGGIPPHAMRGSGQLGIWNLLRLFPTLGWLAVIGIAALAHHAHPTVITGGYLAALAVLCLPANLIVYRQVARPYTLDRSLGAKLARYGFPSMLSSVPQLFNLRLDQMIMASLMSSHLLGLYVVAVAWSSGITPLMTSLGFVLFPRIASQSDAAAGVEVLAQASRLCVILGGILCLIGIPITPMVFPLLFGRQYVEAIPSATILIVGAAILGFNYLLQEGLRGLGYPSAVLWAELGGLGVTAIALVLLLQPLGIVGAAFASLLGYASITMLLLALLRKHTGTSLKHLVRPTRAEFRIIQEKMKVVLTKLTPAHVS